MSEPSSTPENGTPEGQVADAVHGNWVDTKAPEATRPYLRLARADRPIGTWLLLIPCWWSLLLAILSDGDLHLMDVWIAIGCAAGAWLMRGAGCTWNDITDRDFDAAVARTRSRPIPSGQVSVAQAAGFLVLQCLVAFAILITFPAAAIWMGVIALVPVAIYPFAKRFTWWPQFFLGIAFNWGALLGWTAHTGRLEWPAVILYIAGISWTLFYDTIYAHQDKEDDALIGVKSTARLFMERTPIWMARFLLIATALIAIATLGATLHWHNPLKTVIALLGVFAYAAHLVWQMTIYDDKDMDILLKLFRSNMVAGLLLLPFLAVAALV